MILGMEPKNQVNRATRSGVMAFFSERAKMKEFTNVTGPVTSFAGRVNLLLPSWIS